MLAITSASGRRPSLFVCFCGLIAALDGAAPAYPHHGWQYWRWELIEPLGDGDDACFLAAWAHGVISIHTPERVAIS